MFDKVFKNSDNTLQYAVSAVTGGYLITRWENSTDTIQEMDTIYAAEYTNRREARAVAMVTAEAALLAELH